MKRAVINIIPRGLWSFSQLSSFLNPSISPSLHCCTRNRFNFIYTIRLLQVCELVPSQTTGTSAALIVFFGHHYCNSWCSDERKWLFLLLYIYLRRGWLQLHRNKTGLGERRKWTKQLAETFRKGKLASEIQNMFVKRSTACLQFIIIFWKPSHSYQQSCFPSLQIYVESHLLVKVVNSWGCSRASRHDGHLC